MSILARLVHVLVRPLCAAPRPSAADAIVVLGAALRSDGRLGDALRERVDAGIDAWRRGLAPLLLFTGGRTDASPWADLRAVLFGIAARERSALTEASAMRAHALARGVPAPAILVEERARSTEENARYSAAMLRERGIGLRVLVVTQPYHLRRSVALFAEAGVDAAGLELRDSAMFRGGWASLRSLRWVTREYVILAGYRLKRIARG